jgi:hypothetical protein
MTMRPQMKCPWSFQPWTMSLSGQYVPRLKLNLHPEYFLSLEVASQPIFSLFGDFMTVLNCRTMIIIFGHFVPIRNTYGFLYREKSSKFKLFTYYIAEMFACKILHITLRKFASQNVF